MWVVVWAFEMLPYANVLDEIRNQKHKVRQIDGFTASGVMML